MTATAILRTTPGAASAAAVLAGAAGCLAAAVWAPDGLASAWFAGVSLSFAFSWGAMALLLTHGLTGGRWGLTMRPHLLPYLAALPWTLAAFLPLLLVLPRLYPWAGDEAQALPPEQALYLAPALVLVRAGAGAIIWLLAARIAGRTGSAGPGILSAGLIALILAVSIFDIDWILAAEPGFVSTVHPMIALAAGTALAATAAVLLHALAGGGADRGEDLCNLMFGFLLLLAYVHYMQWLVIWAADLPTEIAWYLSRSGGWGAVLVAMVGLAAAVACGLAWRPWKRSRRGQVWLASGAMTALVLEHLWRVAAAFPAPRWPLLPVGLLIAGAAGLALAERRTTDG